MLVIKPNIGFLSLVAIDNSGKVIAILDILGCIQTVSGLLYSLFDNTHTF